MQTENILDFTKARFPELGEEAAFHVEPLEKGGSERMYYRVQVGEASMIFVKYTNQREENLHFVEIAQFLAECGVNVPEIYHHDHTEGLVWMADLGTEDLWTFRDAGPEIRGSLYRSALRQAIRLHSQATARFPSSRLKLQLEFNETLYLWEQDYFFEHAFCGVFGFSMDQALEFSNALPLQSLAKKLAAQPRCLVHRDFQSQNVLIHEGTAWLIDFQGMRPGLPHYDLASLLYDPYVELPPHEREELVTFFFEEATAAGVSLGGDDFREIYLGCAAQRLMQALGAYGFLGLKCGKPGFLRHIPAAKRSLQEVLLKLEGLGEFAEILDSIRETKS